MKTALYYFSGTGKSYTVAKKLQSGLENCQLISLLDCVKNKKYELCYELEYDAVGYDTPSIQTREKYLNKPSYNSKLRKQ